MLRRPSATGSRWSWPRWGVIAVLSFVAGASRRLRRGSGRAVRGAGLRRRVKAVFPGGSIRSGWRRWPISSTPSTRRGPGSLKAAGRRPRRRGRRRGLEAAPRPPSPAPGRPPGIRPPSRSRRRVGGWRARPSRPRRGRGRGPGDVLAARDRDHLRHPEARRRGSDRSRSSATTRGRWLRDGRAHGRQPPLEFAAQLVRLVPGPVVSPRRTTSSSISLSVATFIFGSHYAGSRGSAGEPAIWESRMADDAPARSTGPHRR